MSARAPNSRCPPCGRKKSLRGWTTRQAFLPEGWTSRRTRAWRLYTNHSTELTHSTALAARAAEKRGSRSGLMSKSPTEQAKNKKPGGSRPTGSCETQEAEPPGMKKALGKQFGAKRAQRNRRNGAGHQCVLRGQELLHGSLVRLAVGRSAKVNLWGPETNTTTATRQQERCTHASTSVPPALRALPKRPAGRRCRAARRAGHSKGLR